MAASRASALRRVARVLLLLLVLGLSAQPVLANGGTIQLADQPAGPYAVTVFTSPSPIRVGTVDVSVLVKRGQSEDLVLDAQVMVTAEPIDHQGAGGTFEATHDQATNKLFYAANVSLPTPGRWKLTVQIAGREGSGAVDFTVDVSPALLGMTPVELTCAAIPVLGLVALIFVRWLKGLGKKTTSDVRPHEGAGEEVRPPHKTRAAPEAGD